MSGETARRSQTDGYGFDEFVDPRASGHGYGSVMCLTSGPPGREFGDFSGPRAAERYFWRLAVRAEENEEKPQTSRKYWALKRLKW